MHRRPRSSASAGSTSSSTTPEPTRTTARRSASTRPATTRRSRSTCAGPLFWSQVAYEQAFKDKPGVIINIASVGGLRTEFGLGVYNLTKAALIHLTRQLAGELGPTRVVGIAPGLVKTDFAGFLVENFGDELAARMPTQRLGEPGGHRQPGHVPGQRSGQLDHRRHVRDRRRRRGGPEPLMTVESSFPIITTPDLERALGFYRDLLGGRRRLRLPARGPAGVRVDGPRDVAPRVRPRPLVDLAADAAHRPVDLHRRLRRRSSAPCAPPAARSIEEPTDEPWGERVAHVTDPDGNRIIVGQRLDSTRSFTRRRGGAARGGGPCRARCAGSSRRAPGAAGHRTAPASALTASRSVVERRRAAGRRHDDGRDDLPPLVVRRTAVTATSTTPGRSRSTASTGSGQTFSPPVMMRSPARPVDVQAPVVEPAGRCRRSPTSRRRRAGRCRRGRRAAASDRGGGSAVGVDADLDAVEWPTVVDDTAAGLGHAVRRDDVRRAVGWRARRRRARWCGTPPGRCAAAPSARATRGSRRRRSTSTGSNDGSTRQRRAHAPSLA